MKLLRGLTLVLVVGGAALAASVDERLDRVETEQSRQRRDAVATRGERTFERTCAACHGVLGKGDGPAATDLDPRPRDFVAGAFRFRTTDSGAPARPEDLERTIRKGLPGSSMPAFEGVLSDAEVAELVAFLGTLSSAGQEAPPVAVATPEIGPATPESVREGRALYAVLECWRCHGTRGDGRGPSARGLVDDKERHIDATDFRYDPLKGGREASDIARTILTGLNGVPMPSYADALVFAREDYGDPAADVADMLGRAPTRQDLEAVGPEGRTKLRDERLAALVHYILSLDRRRGFGFWLFRQEPEREARRP